MMRCHDGKAPLIRPGKALLMSGPCNGTSSHMSSSGAAHLGDVDKVAVHCWRAGTVGGWQGENICPKLLAISLRPKLRQDQPKFRQKSSQLDPAQIANKIARNSGPGQLAGALNKKIDR